MENVFYYKKSYMLARFLIKNYLTKIMSFSQIFRKKFRDRYTLFAT